MVGSRVATFGSSGTEDGWGDLPRDLLRDWERETSTSRDDLVRERDRDRGFRVGEVDLERERGFGGGIGFVAVMVVETVP